ncbi:MAG: alpha/beta hydrolase [candidate division Zixibacteria bacterium]|nr:alpha/beta hydrolase [candidate division Zixibacteria bacterium]
MRYFKISKAGRILLICGLVLFTMLAFSCNQKTKTASESVTLIDSVASNDGIMIHYRVDGQGERTLFFVHCWCGDHTYWDEQVKAFKNDYKIVTLDLAGHGESGMNRQEWSIEAFGADVAAVVNKLELQNIILIGHSMGGAVNIAAARLLPGRVIALVGVDTYHNLLEKFTEEQFRQFIAPFEADFPGAVRQFVGTMFPPGADTALVEKITADMASAPPVVGVGALRGLFRYDAVAALKDMSCPIRSINSENYPTNIDGNRSVTASFEVTFLPQYGHFLHLEDPLAFNSTLKKVITEFWPAKTS